MNDEPTVTPGQLTRLEQTLAAKDKTIAALIRRAEGTQSRSASSFSISEQNLALSKVVEGKTAELELRQVQLQDALNELQRAQAQLVQAHKLEAIGQLAAGIAHEINTPTQYVSDNTTFLKHAFDKMLDALRACLEVLEIGKRGGNIDKEISLAESALKRVRIDYLMNQVPKAIEQSLEGLKRIATIVGAMKNFSHPTAGQKVSTDLHDALQSTIIVASNEWKYVAELKTEFDSRIPPILCIRDELNQVILNLIVNAAHSISEKTSNGSNGKGFIMITTLLDCEEVEIRIKDDGCGIPEKIRHRVLEPFFTTKPVGKGTGQGLAIAYSVIVEKHGGSLTFESEMGVGTTFIVRLPLSIPDTPGDGLP